MKIRSINYARLLKLELPQLAKGVLSIVEKHDPEILLVEKAFNDFSSLGPVIESLIVRYGAHPLTEQMKPLRDKRNLYAAAFSFQVKGLVKGYLNGTDDAVSVAKEIVNRYLYNLRSNNEEVINERIDQFLNEYRTNLALQTAITTLNLTQQFDALTDAHSQLLQLLATRNELMSQRPKGVGAVSTKIVSDGLKELFNRIEAAQSDNKVLDYTPLISELNEKLIRYASLIKIRQTVRNNDDTPIEGGMEPTRMMMTHQSVGDASINLNGGNANVKVMGHNNNDQKKAVAMSSKTLQLPDLNNEIN